MHARRALPSLLLAFLMGASVLAVHPTAAFPSPQQSQQVENVFGAGAPYGNWETRVSTNTVYLHSDPTGGMQTQAGNVPVKYTPGPQITHAAMDVHEPDPQKTQSAPSSIAQSQNANNGRQAAIGRQQTVSTSPPAPPASQTAGFGPARFPLADDLRAVDDYNVYGVSTTVWAACTVNNLLNVAGQPSVTTVQARFFVQEFKNGAWSDKGGAFASISLSHGAGPANAPGQASQWSGSTSTGDPTRLTGVPVKTGERVLVEYSATASGQADEPMCILYYDGFFVDTNSGAPRYSLARLTTDALRVATFTARPGDGAEPGEHATGFPSGSLVDPSSRRFVVEALQASAFGEGVIYQLKQKHANVRLYDTELQQYVYYADNYAGGAPREYDIQQMKLVSGRALQLVPEPDIEDSIGQGILRRAYLFSYGDDQPDTHVQPQFYSFDDNWAFNGAVFAIGGRGIDFKALAGENATHLVNPGEPTVFGFVVQNTGTASDVITVAAGDMPGGWTAHVPSGGKFFVAPGGSAVGSVEVIPPPSAANGTQAPVTLTASSSFSDVPNPASITFKTAVTSTLVRKLDISSATATFQVKPGLAKSYAVTVRNLGTARDSIVVVPTFPNNIQGWTIRSNPSSLQLPAGGFADVQILVTPPASAPGGLSFPLGLSVTEVGNAAVTDRVDVTVLVAAAQGILAELFPAPANHTMRLKADDRCVDATVNPGGACPDGEVIVDTDFDRVSLFHVDVQNLGDLPRNYRVRAYWDESVGDVKDDGACEGGFINIPGLGPVLADDPNGVPDGWRFNYGSGVGDSVPPVGHEVASSAQRGALSFAGFSGYMELNGTDDPLTVPARATQPIYFEVGRIAGSDACPENNNTGSDADVAQDDDFSPSATLAVIVTNLDDPSETMTVRLPAVTASPAVHVSDVDIVAPPAQPLVVPTLKGHAATFDLIAVNRGNELDNLRIAVSGNPNWVHQLTPVSRVPGNESGGGCNLPTNEGASVVCSRMGVFDEVHIRVSATPRDSTAIGDRDSITVTVFSGDSAGIFDTQSLTARAAGTLAFSAHVLGGSTRTAAAGHPVSFPIEISNEGTGDDSYRLTLTSISDAAWKPAVSTSTPLFVPAGHDVPAFLTLTPPASTPPGTQVVATLQVESTSSPARQVLQVIGLSTSASPLSLAGSDGQDVLLSARGTPESVTVVATKLQGAAGDQITFKVDRDSLPSDWRVDDGEPDADTDIVRTMAVTAGSALPRAMATFRVTAPAEALGTARALLHVDAATNTTLKAATDIALDLASTQGVGLALADNATQVIAPGGPATYNLTLRNLGLGEDTVTLSNSQLPAGWTLVLNPPSATLGPLQAIDLDATLSAPATAKPGDSATVVLFAASGADPGQVASQVLRAQVGYNALGLDVLGDDPDGAPQETVVRVLNITNTGTLPDQVSMRPTIDTIGLRRSANVSVEPDLFKLDPGQTQQVSVNLRLGGDVPSDSAIQVTALAVSLLDARPEASRANASAALLYHVLPYATIDVNGDHVAEYAVDRDRDAGNGFEEFRANTIPGGRPLSEPDLSRFLRDDARAAFERDVTLANGTVQRVLVYTIDGDGDGKADHFLDADRDGQPDFYWDPDANKATPIEFRKDVNGDQVPESFVDTDGDGKLDATFDLTRGTFTKVLQTDVDGDGKVDYVVDKDGDGQVDQDETVLYTRTGGLLIVQKVDVDGDGKLDQVFDTDGDGSPDYFIPNGSKESVPITMRDVNGDGVMDWTFDGDNDGRKESYYDPATGQSHTIDAAGHFVDALKQYWYIGALFAVVVVLFVALVLVTRR